MKPRRPPIEHLRTAIDCLPVTTREAMLSGVKESDIIVGGYSDGRGGVCPMLAAHRRGGRTDLLAFSRAWDGFAQARRARRATVRELRVLTSHLEASLLAEDDAEAERAMAEHRALTARRAGTARPGDPHRASELRGRGGWAWLRPFRRYDQYVDALDGLKDEDRAAAPHPREPVA